MKQTTFGTPYFPAGANGAICPVCLAVVKQSGKHWEDAGHMESDVTKESMDAAFAKADGTFKRRGAR